MLAKNKISNAMLEISSFFGGFGNFMVSSPNTKYLIWMLNPKRAIWYNAFNQKHTVNFIWFDKYPSEMNVTRIGDYASSLGKINTYVNKDTAISIGSYTSIAKNLTLITVNGHDPRSISTYIDLSRTVVEGDIDIGNDVWIGDDVTIRGGVKIGDGAVVGTKSLVLKDVKPYEIVGGVPARHIRYRFNKNTRTQLMKIKWWEWPVDKVRENAKLFASPDDFIKRFRS